MPLNLNARRIAMLEEMGIRVWQPPAPAIAPTAAESVAASAIRVEGSLSASWLVVGDAPRSFDGDAGILLDRMLLAVGRSRSSEGDEGARLAYAVSSSGAQPFSPEALIVGRQGLRDILKQARPSVILALGRHAAACLLDSSEPLDDLRGRQHDFEGVPVVVSYPVQHLIRQPEAKARAWEDLCAAAQFAAGKSD